MKTTAMTLGVAVLALCAPVSRAETETHVGMRAGVTVGNLSFAGREDLTSSRTGLTAGAFVRVRPNDRLAVQPEILFSMKGDKQDETGGAETLKLSFIEVPILLSAILAPQASAVPSIFLGPMLAFNTGATETTTMTSTTPGGFGELGGPAVESQEESDIDMSEDFKAIDVGVVVGGGLDFRIGDDGRALGLDVRYNFGLRDLDAYERDRLSVRSRTLSITTSYTFL